MQRVSLLTRPGRRHAAPHPSEGTREQRNHPSDRNNIALASAATRRAVKRLERLGRHLLNALGTSRPTAALKRAAGALVERLARSLSSPARTRRSDAHPAKHANPPENVATDTAPDAHPMLTSGSPQLRDPLPLAPAAGLEPATRRLTAACSTD